MRRVDGKAQNICSETNYWISMSERLAKRKTELKKQIGNKIASMVLRYDLLLKT